MVDFKSITKKEPTIFIICGRAGSGKDEVAKYINSQIKSSVNLQFSFYLKEYAKKIISWDGNEKTKPRDFLQQFGSDFIRNRINDHFLIKRMIEDINIYAYFFDVITISDCRLIDEITEIKNNFKSVISIKIEREEQYLNEEQNNHETETQLDNYDKFDYIIKNSGNTLELYDKIDNILEKGVIYDKK